MEQLEAVLHAPAFSSSSPRMISVTVRPNFDRKPARRLPAAAAARGQLDAHANLRANADLFGRLQDQAELGVLLDDRDDVAPDLQREHRRLDELGVLEAVADDRRLVVGQRHDRQELRLGARFETEPVGPAEIEHFLDDLPLLVDLDRVDAAIGALVLVLRDRRLEGRMNFAEPVPQDVGEPDEHRKADAAELQPIDQLLEVDGLRRILGRMDLHVTRGVHREVAVPPARHLVELAGVVDAPRSGGRGARVFAEAAMGARWSSCSCVMSIQSSMPEIDVIFRSLVCRDTLRGRSRGPLVELASV